MAGRSVLPALAMSLVAVAAAAPAGAASCPDILIVLDRSCSRNPPIGAPGNKRRYTVAADAMKAVTAEYGGRIGFGLNAFPPRPGEGGACSPGKTYVDIGVGNAPAIAAALDDIDPVANKNCGTPMGATLELLASYPPLLDPARRHYLVFVTDGDPYCAGRRDPRPPVEGEGAGHGRDGTLVRRGDHGSLAGPHRGGSADLLAGDRPRLGPSARGQRLRLDARHRERRRPDGEGEPGGRRRDLGAVVGRDAVHQHSGSERAPDADRLQPGPEPRDRQPDGGRGPRLGFEIAEEEMRASRSRRPLRVSRREPAHAANRPRRRQARQEPRHPGRSPSSFETSGGTIVPGSDASMPARQKPSPSV